MRLRVDSTVWGGRELDRLAAWILSPMRDEARRWVGPRKARKHISRHRRRKWVRAFAQIAKVAHDAILEGRNGIALRILCEMVPLAVAEEFVYDKPKRGSAWLAQNPGSQELSDLLDRLHARIAESVGVPLSVLLGGDDTWATPFIDRMVGADLDNVAAFVNPPYADRRGEWFMNPNVGVPYFELPKRDEVPIEMRYESRVAFTPFVSMDWGDVGGGGSAEGARRAVLLDPDVEEVEATFDNAAQRVTIVARIKSGKLTADLQRRLGQALDDATPAGIDWRLDCIPHDGCRSCGFSHPPERQCGP